MRRYFNPPTVDAIKAAGGVTLDAHSEATHEALLAMTQPGDSLVVIFFDASLVAGDVTATADFDAFRRRQRAGLATMLGYYSVPRDSEGWAPLAPDEMEVNAR